MKPVLRLASLLLLSMVTAHALDVVQTTAGKVSGAKTVDGAVLGFKGIPFAAPPVGDLRWKAPQPARPWNGVRECAAYGASPMQGKPAPFSMWSKEFLIPDEPISEDCLNLNIWTGARSADEKRPVLVWIYGGGFSSGGNACPIYDGEAMARKGIVFVGLNYRVGIFGFFSHPELTKESGVNASGNYGLMDQIAALKWVRDNIAAFGGDPAKVTIAGQSAGSMSVNCLVASPQAKGLFQRAIAESGASFVRSLMTLDQAEKAGATSAEKLNSATLAELRKLSATDLMKQGGRGPIIDGHILTEPISKTFAAVRQNPVDLITGWNEDEGFQNGPPKTAEEYRKQIRDQHGYNADIYLSHYPASNDEEAARSQLQASRDTAFGVANYMWANAQAAHGKGRVFVYRFTRKVPGTGQYAKYGAFHTGEVPYAYDNLKFVDRPWEAVDHALATTMSSYWAAFVATGDPNAGGQPKWPAYEPEGRKVMLLGNVIEARPMPGRAALDFMQTLLVK
jgi:para-nitrobenzyl esterase